MKIWLLDCDVEHYENLTWKKIDVDEIRSYDGRPKLPNWKPLQVKRIYHRDFSNSLGLSAHIPVFDKKAIETLGDLLNGNAEILPLECKNGEFFAINITNVLDCIDYGKSEYELFNDGKRIMLFTKYAFDITKIRDEQIFKIADKPLSYPFVSDEFRNRVLSSGLTGFKFELAWDSDEGNSKENENI